MKDDDTTPGDGLRLQPVEAELATVALHADALAAHLRTSIRRLALVELEERQAILIELRDLISRAGLALDASAQTLDRMRRAEAEAAQDMTKED